MKIRQITIGALIALIVNWIVVPLLWSAVIAHKVLPNGTELSLGGCNAALLVDNMAYVAMMAWVPMMVWIALEGLRDRIASTGVLLVAIPSGIILGLYRAGSLVECNNLGAWFWFIVSVLSLVVLLLPHLNDSPDTPAATADATNQN